jgi:hypothetical protein
VTSDRRKEIQDTITTTLDILLRILRYQRIKKYERVHNAITELERWSSEPRFQVVLVSSISSWSLVAGGREATQ